MIKGLKITSSIDLDSGATVTDAFVCANEFNFRRDTSTAVTAPLFFLDEAACDAGKRPQVAEGLDLEQVFSMSMTNEEFSTDACFLKLKEHLENKGAVVVIVNA